MVDVIPDGYTATPPVDWLTAFSEGEAWSMYTFRKATHAYPVPGTDPATEQPCWRLHPRGGSIPERRVSMADFIATHGPVHAPPSPGGSDKAAKLKPEDRKAISEREAKAAAKRRAEAEKIAEDERRTKAQGSLFQS